MMRNRGAFWAAVNLLVAVAWVASCSSELPKSGPLTYIPQSPIHGGSSGNPNAKPVDPNGRPANPNDPANPNGMEPAMGPTPQPGVRLLSRLATGSCLDANTVADGSGAAPVVVRVCSADPNVQTWEIAAGQVRLPNGACLDLEGPAGADVPLVTAPCGAVSVASQQWQLVDGALATDANNVTWCAALKGGGTLDDTPILLEVCATTNDAQHWDAAYSNGSTVGGFAIATPQAPSQCLAAPSTAPAMGDGLSLASCTAPGAGQWMLDGLAGDVQLFGLTVGGRCVAAQAATAGSGLTFQNCTLDSLQQWDLVSGTIRLANTALCIATSGGAVSLAACTAPGTSWALGRVQ